MAKPSANAAGAPIRDTVEAPADTPASSGEDDGGDEPEPTPAELQSGDDTLPHADEAVENSPTAEEATSGSITETDLEAANDNSPAEELPATGTEG